MRNGFRLTTMLALLTAAGCGGGGSGGTTTGSGTTYSFAPPTAGASGTSAVTIVDNANNTIELSQTSTVLSVNPDGSFTTLSQESSTGAVVVNGTNYLMPPTTHTINGSDQETSYEYTDATTGAAVTCSYDPHGLGPDGPLGVGQTWTLEFTFGCGTATPIMYTQMGSVVDIESVTVPAGTYTALKLQSTVTWTTAAGAMRSETITNWRNSVGLGSVKQEITYAYGAPLPTAGYPLSRQIVLQ
jgi:hypothetical protein